MTAIDLDTLTSPEVRDAIAGGRETVVFALGATEQHGPHLPLATDALLGDHLARLVADRLDAFVGPTVRVGCSSHHLEFAGTLSVDNETFAGIVHGLVRSAARGGFARIVLIPTHGGNFGPLGAALERLETDLRSGSVHSPTSGSSWRSRRRARRSSGCRCRQGDSTPASGRRRC